MGEKRKEKERRFAFHEGKWEMNFIITLVNMPEKDLWYQMDSGIKENNNNGQPL